MKKLWIWILIGLLAAAGIAAAVALDITGGRRASSKPYEHNINYFYSNTESTTRFVIDAETLTDKLIGNVDAFLSCDGTRAVVRAGGALYSVDKDGVKSLYPAGTDLAILSLDGGKAIFTTATEVHIVDLTTGSTEDIKPEGVSGIGSVVVSPDGKTVGYSVKKGDKWTAYAHENGESRLLREDACIAGIADGAAYWYFVDMGDYSLRFMKGGRERKLSSSFSGMIEFSRDLKDAIFDEEGVTYYSRMGRDPKPLAEGNSLFTAGLLCSAPQGGGPVNAEVKDTNSLLGRLYYSYRTSSEGAPTVYDLWYVNGRGSAKLLAKNAYKFFENEDGSRLSVLMADGKLYDMDMGEPKGAQLIASGVADYCSMGDGTFYYIDSNGGLFFVNGVKGAKPMQAASGVSSCAVSPEKICVFLTKSNELCYAKNGVATELALTGVRHMETMGAAVFCYTEPYTDEYGVSVYDVYSSADGLEWSLAVPAVPRSGN